MNLENANKITEQVIGAAIEVHRTLGPGLIESTYETCLVHELHARNIAFERQRELPLIYKGLRLEAGYRLDLVVENADVVELKSVEALLPLHAAQLISYLRLSGLPLGLLINFNVVTLKEGIRRVINKNLVMTAGAP
jgi:GxxExxY protein